MAMFPHVGSCPQFLTHAVAMQDSEHTNPWFLRCFIPNLDRMYILLMYKTKYLRKLGILLSMLHKTTGGKYRKCSRHHLRCWVGDGLPQINLTKWRKHQKLFPRG